MPEVSAIVVGIGVFAGVAVVIGMSLLVLAWGLVRIAEVVGLAARVYARSLLLVALVGDLDECERVGWAVDRLPGMRQRLGRHARRLRWISGCPKKPDGREEAHE